MSVPSSRFVPSPGPRRGRATDGPDAEWIRRRERWYARAFGPPREPAVYHWEDGGDPHVDVYVHSGHGPVSPELLVTGGLADRPMPDVSPFSGAARRVEILFRTARAEDWMPPLLREIAALPFRYRLALRAEGVVEGNREIHEGSALRHALLTESPPPPLPDPFLVEGEAVRFLEVSFLTDEEFAFALEAGPAALVPRLAAAGALGVLTPSRKSVVGGPR